MSIKLSRVLLLGLTAVLTVLPAAAQAPDCTGISDVSDYDGANISDFDGQLTAVRIVSGLLRPLFVTSPPGDVDRLFIVEQDGLIKILRDGAVLATPFLDVSALTQSPIDIGGFQEGLLGLAFHPDYDINGWFFIYHTNVDGSANVVARYKVSANPDVADPTSRHPVISIDHPTYFDQNGGMLAFSPLDGYLYIGSGDGGGGCDPADNAQDLESNNGKLLRLNVDADSYTTTGNPFDGAIPGNDEIWSYGLRNPWRFSFDRITGGILIGDVGEAVWEEIDCQPPGTAGGQNYGWRDYEGLICPAPSAICPPTADCELPAYVDPVRVYDSTGDPCAVTGGYVYRGCRMSDLHGTYFYAEYCIPWFIRTFRVDASCVTSAEPDLDRTADLAPGGGLFITSITSFGEDARGELYIVDQTGEVYKILPALGIMELSALNAPPLFADTNDDWVWEDLEKTSGHPITSYKVYRSDDRTGTFDCVHQTPTPSWVGGDPVLPGVGGTFYYVVTALNALGEETRPGAHSDGTPRDVDFASTCP